MLSKAPLQIATIQPYTLYDGALGPLFMRLAERLQVERIAAALLTHTDGGEPALQGIAGLNVGRETLEHLTILLSAETDPLVRVAQSGRPMMPSDGVQQVDPQHPLHVLVGPYPWVAMPIPYLPDLPPSSCLGIAATAQEDILSSTQEHTSATSTRQSTKHLSDCSRSTPEQIDTPDSEMIASLPVRGVLIAARATPLDRQELIVLELAAAQLSAALLGLEAAQNASMDALEEGRIRQQLFESEKLAATGRLTASIAHEINNPLEAIKNALYLLVAGSKPDDPQRAFLELAQRETERVSRIIRQMLGVARPSARKTLTDVNKIVQEVLALVDPQLRRRHIIPRLELDETLPPILASADQLKQVFLNLVLNARDAMPNGGELLIQTRMAQRQDNIVLAEKHLVVRVRDDGAGIPEEVRRRVFEPFFSTKGEHRGTGLGLWVCQEIIRSHGGQIQVNSKVGKGTTFLVGLPLPPEYDQASSAPTYEHSASS